MMKWLAWTAAGALLIWLGSSARAIVFPLETAFRATRAKPAGYSMNGWVRLTGQASKEALLPLLDQASTEMHVRGPIVSSNGTGYQKESLTAIAAGIRTRLIVERLSSGQTYLVLDRVTREGFWDVSASEQLFRAVLSRYGAVHLALTLNGEIPGRMSTADELKMMHRAFDAVGASWFDGVSTARYLSEAGQTPLIPSHDLWSGRPVNLQIAVGYNAYLRATQVDVGSPLVTVTY